MRYCLKNAQIVHGGVFRPVDVLIEDGKIASVGSRISCSGDVVSIDLYHFVLMPGFVDVHVHLREPGFSYKETISTGTMAAARGGFTHVACMPNLAPVPDCPENLAPLLAAISAQAHVQVSPYGAITRGELGQELAALEALAPDVLAFSDDGKGVQSEEMMHEAMRRCRSLGKVLAAHCEDNSLLRGGYIHDGAYARQHGHRGICAESEWRPIERDLALAERTGCAYHVCHVSTKESVALIRAAKKRGVDVTCETAPHYLVLCEDDLQEDGRFKMNPPLRAREDRAALIEGICDGTIDMIATDHAPHSREEKSRGLEKSAMGVVGLETAFAVCYTHLVKTGVISLARLLELMHDAPMHRFGIGAPLEEGARADLTAFDLQQRWRVDPAQFLSLGRATPFAGETLYGVCKMTMVGGEPVWKEAEL